MGTWHQICKYLYNVDAFSIVAGMPSLSRSATRCVCCQPWQPLGVERVPRQLQRLLLRPERYEGEDAALLYDKTWEIDVVWNNSAGLELL